MKPQTTLLVRIVFCFLPLISYSQVFSEIGCEKERYAEAFELLNSYRTLAATDILNEIIDCAKSDGDEFCHRRAKYELTRGLEILDKDDEALEAFRSLMMESTMANDDEIVALVYIGIARLYEKKGFIDECKENLEAAAKIVAKKNLEDKKLQAYYLIRWTSYLRLNNRADEALVQVDKLLDLTNKVGFEEFSAIAYMLKGIIMSTLGDEAQSLYFKKKSEREYRILEDYHATMALNISIAYMNKSNNDIEGAIQRFKIADNDLESCFERGSGSEEYLKVKTYISEPLASIYAELNQYDSAYVVLKNMQQRVGQVRTIRDRDTKAEMEGMMNFNREKDQLLIKEKEERIKKERYFSYLLGSGLLLLISFSILLLRSRREVIQANTFIANQNEEIEQKNGELNHALDYQKLLLGELHHRVKNNHQLIINFLELHIEQASDSMETEQFEVLKGRIYALSTLHESLYEEENLSGANLSIYLNKLCVYLREASSASISLRIDPYFDDIQFDLGKLISLGILLNELYTNSLKYSGISEENLLVEIILSIDENGTRLIYRDNGVGFDSDSPLKVKGKGGLGTYLINSMANQLGATISRRNNEGAEAVISLKEQLETV